MFRIALRSHITGVLGWGGLLTLLAVVEAGSFTRVAAATPGGRDQLAAGMMSIAQQTSYLLPNPGHLNTLGGYVGWFLFGYMPLFYGVWAVVAGTAASRGDEEKGLVDQWLATGMPRWRLLLVRFAAFAVAVTVATGLPMVVVAAIALGANEPLNIGGMILQGLPGIATSGVCFAIGLLAGQLVATRRNALGVGMIAVLGLYLLNGFSRQDADLKPYRWISPFAYSDLSDPIVTGGHLDIPGVLVICVMAAAVLQLAIGAFSNRDLGSTLFGQAKSAHKPMRVADTNPLVRTPVLVSLWDQRIGLITWSVAIGLYAAMNISLVRPFVKFFTSQGTDSVMAAQAKAAFGTGKSDPYAGFIGAEWYTVACLLLAAFAITQVSRWASDDTEGRVEMTLSAGVPRWRVIVERVATLSVAAAILLTFNTIAVYAAAHKNQIDLDVARVIAASILVIPMALAFGGLGAAIAAIRPRPAMIALTSVLVASYMFPLMAVPMFAPHQPPDWFVNLSVFKLYGVPLTDGTNWPGLWALTAIVAIGFGGAFVAMERREVGR